MTIGLVEQISRRVLDDEEAGESKCPACRGHGCDRHGDDCAFCGGLGVFWK